jgi:type IV secretion system protein VirD4
MMNGPPRPQPRPREEGWEGTAFVAVLALIGFGLVLWATGELSGLIANGNLTGAKFSQMGKVLVKLPEHASDPRMAWPRGVRNQMSGPFIFYGVLAILITAAGFIALLLYRIFKGSFSGSASGSSWASPGDLRALVVKNPEPGRLTLGRVGSKLVAAEERQSVIVLGPTQSGKTTGLAIPAILEWEGPVLATSVKSDLLRDTLEMRQNQDDVWVYDPTSSTSQGCSGWSPLASCGTWHGAQKTASWLAEAAPSGSTGLSDAEFWYQAAAKLLAPLMFAAARSGGSIADVVRWVNLQEQREVLKALQGADQGAIDAAQASFKRDGRQKSSVYTTAETVLAAYEDPIVAKSAEVNDISPHAFLDRGSRKTLYVVAPSHEQRRLRPLFETLLHTIISYAYERASQDGPLNPPLLLVLDEAANIAPLRNLDALASTAAGHGIQLVSIFQDLAQISNIYRDRAQTVVNNHRAKIIASGISDTQTLEYASRLLGDEEILQASITRGAQGSRSTTESTSLRSLAPANVLRGIRPGEGVLVYGHLPPARLKLRPWFQEHGLRRAS